MYWVKNGRREAMIMDLDKNNESLNIVNNYIKSKTFYDD